MGYEVLNKIIDQTQFAFIEGKRLLIVWW